MPEKSKKVFLPLIFKQPVMLVWLFILPQVILLLINANAMWLIGKEMVPERLYQAGIIGWSQVGILFLATVIWWTCRTKAKEVHIGWSIVLLLSQIAYLYYVTANLGRIVPPAIEVWILDLSQLMLGQYTFMMPGLFYSTIRLACFDVKMSKPADLAVSLGLAVGVPAVCYFMFVVMSGFNRFGWSSFYSILMLLIMIGATVAMFIGLVRAVLIMYQFLQKQDGILRQIFLFIICLSGPVMGLWLNRLIPFPADFQSTAIYVLAVINGLVLMVPAPNKEAEKWLLFPRAVMYPFTFYFFLVFLPFLPLSIPAMFAIGSGSLILVPLILFLVHSNRLIDHFKTFACNRQTMTAIILFTVGISLLPGYMIVEAYKDKTTLAQALQYVYAPDYSKDHQFSGSVESVKRTLVRLKELKHGIQLPYISGLYNKIVFESMVLPEKKIDSLYRLFSGEELKLIRRDAMGVYNQGNRNMWSGNFFNRTPPERTVDLVSTHVETVDAGETVKARVRLEMENTGKSSLAEFYREITVPPGVIITGMSLKIGKDMVPAKIFEKSTALWVYHMIRDVSRRDPAILTYKSPTRIDFNVFPFTTKERRTAEIEFQFLKGPKTEILIGEQAVVLSPGQDYKLVIRGQFVAEGFVAVVPSQAAVNLPKGKRQPYLHFILDYSKGTDFRRYSEQIKAVRQKFPEIKNIKITAANFNAVDFEPFFWGGDSSLTLEQFLPHALPVEGALDLDRVIKQTFLKHLGVEEYPLFVVVTNRKMSFETSEMEYYCADFPESRDLIVSNSPESFTEQPLCPSKSTTAERIVLRTTSIPADRQTQVIYFPNARSGEKFFVYDGKEGFTIEVPYESFTDEAYARRLGLLYRNFENIKNPARLENDLPSLVQESKSLGVMIPSTSYMVVERDSQWKILQVKEKQKMGTSAGLEFSDEFKTPAPPLWLMVLAMVLFYWWKNNRQEREFNL